MNDTVRSLDELRKAMGKLWPLAKGSLSQVRKPCVRRNCRACASGEKHPVWLFSFRQSGRRRCMYVAEAVVPELQQAIENGRRVEALMADAGEALIRQLRAREEPH
jgi:hypothetical protein